VRIVAILRVRDEVDLLAGSVHHLRELGVDIVVVVDEGSTDGTLALLDGPKAEGWLRLIHATPGEPGWERADERVLAEVGPHWLLRVAVDDRLLTVTGSLHDLVGLEGVDVVEIERYPAAVSGSRLEIEPWSTGAAIGGVLIHAAPLETARPRPWWRDEPHIQCLRPRPLRLERRGGPDQRTAPMGAPGVRRLVADDAIAVRAPLTSWTRFRRTVAASRDAPAGWPGEPREAAPEWVMDRWRAMEEPALHDAFERQLLHPAELRLLTQRHAVRPARELLDHRRLARPVVPVFDGMESYSRALETGDAWLAGLRGAARQLGLDPSAEMRYLGGKYPTAAVGDAVIRLYGPWRRGSTAMAREAAVLELIAQDPRIPAPRLLGTGWVDASWSWLAMSRMSGQPLLQVRMAGSDIAPPMDVADWLGIAVHRLHRVPVEPALREAVLPRLHHEIRALHASVVVRKRNERTLDPRLLERLAAWMPPVDDLLPDADDLVAAHLDLHEGNILGVVEAGRFVGKGIVDLGNAWVAHPLQELGAICGQTLRGDRTAIATFLDRAGLPLPPGEDGSRIALCWMLLDDADQFELVPGASDIEDPDTLARRLFGGIGA
jgi:aminoglycoside phosphotransferase